MNPRQTAPVVGRVRVDCILSRGLVTLETQITGNRLSVQTAGGATPITGVALRSKTLLTLTGFRAQVDPLAVGAS